MPSLHSDERHQELQAQKAIASVAHRSLIEQFDPDRLSRHHTKT
jgi:hypothetical protein